MEVNEYEKLLKQVYQTTPIGLCLFDTELRYRHINEWLASINGLSVDEHLGQTISEVIPDVSEGVEALLRRVMETGEPVLEGVVESETQAWPHQKRIFQHSYHVIKSDEGIVMGVSCIVQDITERKQGEEAIKRARDELEDRVRERTEELRAINESLCESEERYLSLSEASFEGLMIHDRGRVIDANTRFQKMFGYSLEELIEMSAFKLIASENREQVRQNVTEGREGPHESVGLRKDSTTFPMEIQARHMQYRGKRVRVVACRDITERKRVEEALRENQERLALAFDVTSEGLWDWNIATDDMFYSPQWCAALGFDPSEVEPYGRFWVSLVHPDDMPRFTEALNAHFDGKTETYECEVRLRAKSGEYRWNLDRGKVVAWDDDGRPLRMVGVDVDITERKQAEQALRESESRYRAIFESEPACVKLLDANGVVVDMNPAGLKMAEADALDQIADRPMLDLIDPSHRDGFTRLHRKVLAGESVTGEFEIIGLKGRRRWIQTHAVPLRDADGNVSAHLAVTHDITERKQAEAERAAIENHLRDMQKLEAVGTLAAGFAHDINNSLTAILAYAAAARKQLPDEHFAAEMLDGVERASNQAASVAKSLLTFSRRSEPLMARQDLADLVRESVAFIKPVLPANIELQLDPAPSASVWVEGDKSQLEQMILNLEINARDAMPDGGILRVSLAHQSSLPGNFVSQPPRSQFGYVVLTIDDSGIGMSDEVKERIFDPFFSTKPRGSGTGLGMSIVHGIVSDHQGSIRIETAEGRGTRVSVALPCCEPGADRSSPVVEVKPVAGEQETILLAEDNDQIRAIVAMTLESANYKVHLASDGIDALRVFQEHAPEFSVLILDVDMPKMSGIDCLKKIRESNAEVPAIMISGLMDEPLASHSIENVSFLRKPFQMNDLIDLMHHMRHGVTVE